MSASDSSRPSVGKAKAKSSQGSSTTSVLLTTSKALVTRSDALVPSSLKGVVGGCSELPFFGRDDLYIDRDARLFAPSVLPTTNPDPVYVCGNFLVRSMSSGGTSGQTILSSLVGTTGWSAALR